MHSHAQHACAHSGVALASYMHMGTCSQVCPREHSLILPHWSQSTAPEDFKILCEPKAAPTWKVIGTTNVPISQIEKGLPLTSEA